MGRGKDMPEQIKSLIVEKRVRIAENSNQFRKKKPPEPKPRGFCYLAAGSGIAVAAAVIVAATIAATVAAASAAIAAPAVVVAAAAPDDNQQDDDPAAVAAAKAVIAHKWNLLGVM